MDIIKNKKSSQKLLPAKPTRSLVTGRNLSPIRQIENPKNTNLLAKPETAFPILMSWKAPEFIYYEKTTQWYFIMGLVGIALTLYAIFTKNPIMAITFGLIFIVIFIYAEKKPLILQYSLTPKGIKMQDRIYYFNYLESFWIFYNPLDVKFISIKSRKTFMPLIRIPLGKANPLEARKILLKYLPEEEQQESIIDIIARITKI